LQISDKLLSIDCFYFYVTQVIDTFLNARGFCWILVSSCTMDWLSQDKKYLNHVIASVIVVLSQIFIWKSLTVISRRQRRTNLGASRFSGEDARVKLNPIVDGIHERRYYFPGGPWTRYSQGRTLDVRSFCKYERDLFGSKRAAVKIRQL